MSCAVPQERPLLRRVRWMLRSLFFSPLLSLSCPPPSPTFFALPRPAAFNCSRSNRGGARAQRLRHRTYRVSVGHNTVAVSFSLLPALKSPHVGEGWGGGGASTVASAGVSRAARALTPRAVARSPTPTMELSFPFSSTAQGRQAGRKHPLDENPLSTSLYAHAPRSGQRRRCHGRCGHASAVPPMGGAADRGAAFPATGGAPASSSASP